MSSKIIAKAKARFSWKARSWSVGATAVKVDAIPLFLSFAPTLQAFDNVGLGLPVAQLLVKA